MIFACGNNSTGNDFNGGGSMSDFACSYLTLYPDSLDNLNFSQKKKSIISGIKANGIFDNSNIVSNHVLEDVKNNLQENVAKEKSSEGTWKPFSSPTSFPSINNWFDQSPPSSHPEVIRPISEQSFPCGNATDKLTRKIDNSGTYELAAPSYDQNRRKLSSVSKRNSKYKIMNDETWSSDETDTSVATSKFGNYLSNLSACPSLENCTNRRTNRKSKKNLPKESKSPREKCYDFLHRNFYRNFSANSKKIAGKGKDYYENSKNSSSTEFSNSELEVMDFVYSDDSLEDFEKSDVQKIAQNSYMYHGSGRRLPATKNFISSLGALKHPTILSEEIEILQRQLILKDLELQESLRINGTLSLSHSSQHPTLTSLFHNVEATDHIRHTKIKTSPSFKSDVSHRSSINLHRNSKHQGPTVYRRYCSPSLYPSPEPQILTEGGNDAGSERFTLPRVRRRNSIQNPRSDSSFSMPQTYRPGSGTTCTCSIDTMSQPVQSLLKFIHPAKNSSPHSAFNKSRSSLWSDSSNYEHGVSRRLSLTSQFWSKKQMHRDRGVTDRFLNAKKSSGTSYRMHNRRVGVSASESNPGVTPFGCTGFFIPAKKMNSTRKQSDPFINACSRKTLDLMRSVKLHATPGHHMSYHYLSRVMKLDNDLKIIPERLTISSKPFKTLISA